MRPLLASLAGLAVLLCVAGGWIALVYQRDMGREYQRIQSRGQVMASPFGDIEVLEGGTPTGPAVLLVHGSGGGYDQGELLGHAALGKNTALRWIAPSRFGYLRSTFKPGATFDDQAHAYAFLLDRLGIDRIAVVALSHGGPSALLFAALHPDRVSSLTLISAGVAASGAADQAQANDKGSALTAIFQQDVRYWVLTHTMRRRFLELMGVSPTVSASLTPEQRRLADDVIDRMNPVSPRAAGTVFDNQAAMPNERIAAIRAPTLVLHARDDGLQLFHNAEFAANHIANARLVAFERGGHLLLAVEQPAVQRLVVEHICRHAGDPAVPGATRLPGVQDQHVSPCGR
ncbi:MAG: alpha/beta hydrolase [Burkholderiaceae bacterium]|nr:alpha/beta hydrolase [Burkholderiaceae bacterium]